MPAPGDAWIMVHGHAAELEIPADGLKQTDGRAWTDIVGARFGWGSTFVLEGRGPGSRMASVVFHYAVPVPVQTFDPPGTADARSYRAHLKGVGFQGELSTFGRIEFVDVWERHNRIFTTRGTGWGIMGDFRNRWDLAQLSGPRQEGNVFDVPSRPTVWGALGVSIGFSGALDQTRLTITQVGALIEYR